MNKAPQTLLVPGEAGNIEAILELPPTEAGSLRGIALVAHPHPLGGGANTNKVAYALARAFLHLGYAAVRPNFRGVGKSEGVHDEGRGETDDLATVLQAMRARLGPGLPVALAGFSFGAHCQLRLANRLAEAGGPPCGMALVGTATGSVPGAFSGDIARHYATPAVPQGVPALIIHGAKDTTVALQNVLDWAEPQELPVLVIPGADHFFHGRLQAIRDAVARWWQD